MPTTSLSRHLCLSLLLVSSLAACSEERVSVPFKDATTGDEDASTQLDTGVVLADATTQDTGPAPNCDSNPASCEPGRLKGPPPMCMCLSGCTAGFTWNGTACVQDTVPDAGQPDADPSPDAVVAPDADPAPDAVVAPDAVGAADAVVAPDVVVVIDGGVVVADTGVVRDGGAVGDGGVGLDGGFVPTGLFEGDTCNWSQPNNCLQAPGMICQQLNPTDPAGGICLKTCNVAQNLAGNANPACNGVGLDCLDVALQPAGGRCLNAIGAYQNLLDVLDVCDPSVPNLGSILGEVCWPLCTYMLPPPPASQVPLTCSGRFNTCLTDPGDLALNDGAGGILATCGLRTTRTSTCNESRGVHCAANTDLCVLGRCHQAATAATCAGVTCTAPGEVCAVVGTAPNQVALCHRPCSVFQSGACPGTDTCDLTGFGGAPTGSCRSVSGTVPAGGDCSDVFALGTAANDCVAGTTCTPVGTTNDFTDASCLQLCSGTLPGAPACPVGTTCDASGQSYGVCY